MTQSKALLLLFLVQLTNANAHIRGAVTTRHLKNEKNKTNSNSNEDSEDGGNEMVDEILEGIYEEMLEEEEILDVLIVGGGWSGLAALDYIVRKDPDLNVQLLEAYDFLGGRSRTIYDFDPNAPTELGSSWLQEDTIVEELANELNLDYGTIEFTDEWSYLGLYDEIVTVSLGDGVDASLTSLQKMFLITTEWQQSFVQFEKHAKKIKDAEDDMSYQTLMDGYFTSEDYTGTNHTQRFITTMVHSQLDPVFAAPLDQLSAQGVGEQLNECVFCGGHLHTGVPTTTDEVGGFARLIYGLADPHASKIGMNSRVTKVDYNSTTTTANKRQADTPTHPIRVTYEGINGTQTTVSARHVLMTVSLGVLQSGDIDFVPPLPSSKQDAMDSIGMGTLNKCILYWDEDVGMETTWDEGEEIDASGATVTSRASTNNISSWWPQQPVLTFVPNNIAEPAPGLWTTFLNERSLSPNSSYVLSSWIGGQAAQWSEENQSDEDVLENIMTNLRTMLGDRVPEPSKYLVTRWGQDELTYGSFSFPKAGIDTASARKELGNPIGNDHLFFAGEATDEDYGTTFGAYASGRRAAEAIVKAAKKDK